jgi:hypothetical protein
MGRSKAYTVAGVVYPRQADLEAAVHAALGRHPLDRVFRDAFLAAVINTLHREVRAAGQQSTGQFEYLSAREQARRGLDTAWRYRGGKLLRSEFLPLAAWRPVTVYPWRTPADPRQALKRALREKLAAYLPHPTAADRCARAPCPARGADLEYEHLAPRFDALATAALALMQPAEIATQFGYSKFVPGCDELAHCIPDAHPAFQALLAAHRTNRWEWLCAFHHRHVGARRPQQLGLPLEVFA